MKNLAILPLNILLLSLLFLAACNKDKDTDALAPCSGTPDTSYITSPDLLNCIYQGGSYWVYIDSVTNLTDSVYITTATQTFLFDQCRTYFDSHSYSTISHPTMITHSYRIVAGGIFKNATGVNTGTAIYTGTHLDSMFVYDRYYKNITQTTITNDPTENNNKTIYYINSDFGFLRTDIIDTNGITISQKVLMRGNIMR